MSQIPLPDEKYEKGKFVELTKIYVERKATRNTTELELSASIF